MCAKKKILFFTPSTVGGAERVTLTIAKMLPKDEYDVKVIFVCREIGGLRSFVPEEMPCHHIYIYNIWDFATIKIWRTIHKEKPYAVFCSFRYLSTRMLIAAKLAGVKSIVRIENMLVNLRWDYKWLMRKTFRWADGIIAQSEEMRNELICSMPCLRNKVSVLLNPIDIQTIDQKVSDCENPFDMAKTNYVYVGRIAPQKAIETLLEAFKRVQSRKTNSCLTIVGDMKANQTYAESLQRKVKDLNLVDNVRFAGFQDNPYKYTKYADCFVLVSRLEGCPNVLLEAMYLQTPVVATRSVPVVERIVSADHGIVVDVDDVEAIASAMLRAVTFNITSPFVYDDSKEWQNKFTFSPISVTSE